MNAAFQLSLSHLFERQILLRVALFFFLSSYPCFTFANLWQEGERIPKEGRANPLNLSASDFEEFQLQGRMHAQIYPVEVTGLLPPLEPVSRAFSGFLPWPFDEARKKIFFELAGFSDWNSFLKWIGLPDYPKESDEGVYALPYPHGVRPDFPVGFSEIFTERGRGFSISCAACHSSVLFGKTVLGMTNRFPRTTETFELASRASRLVTPIGFQLATQADSGEKEMFRDVRKNLKRVGFKRPALRGLDTSLAQVALSLNRRSLDPWATPHSLFEKQPRPDLLDHLVADSKPSVWWNVKYKNRWLSDGSVVSGNPIYTNLLWNEIGRGTDLKVLMQWIYQNQKKIDELVTAVFSSEAPRYSDFFDIDENFLLQAKGGESVYRARCSRCHGLYEKVWSSPEAAQLPLSEQIKTSRVQYHSNTPIVNVGTDSKRALGMISLAEKLNPLLISQEMGILIRPQQGYVPPPLVGIWARWPYFHHNSAPTLCAVLSPGPERPVRYLAREPINKDRDFDQECNGYPSSMRSSGDTPTALYDSEAAGLSRLGHDEGILSRADQLEMTSIERRHLIRYLQTL